MPPTQVRPIQLGNEGGTTINRAGTVRTALAVAFVFGVLDDLLTSTKLLVTGKLLASGNLMRQVVEGIAMAAVCSIDELLVSLRRVPR
ncbi:hypothetical protein WI72_20820 [Burkholderia ubonensis]|nr:hypothetical protein WI72_20820 [Burkholderia ubonensis]